MNITCQPAEHRLIMCTAQKMHYKHLYVSSYATENHNLEIAINLSQADILDANAGRDGYGVLVLQSPSTPTAEPQTPTSSQQYSEVASSSSSSNNNNRASAVVLNSSDSSWTGQAYKKHINIWDSIKGCNFVW